MASRLGSCALMVALPLALFLSISPAISPVGASNVSWVSLDVMSFDGQAITLKLTLLSPGNHANAEVHVWGEFYGGEHDTKPCFVGTCGSESLSAVVGRIITEVTYSADTNITTFVYAASFTYLYAANPQVLGLIVFPWDQHELDLSLTTDFNEHRHTLENTQPSKWKLRRPLQCHHTARRCRWISLFDTLAN